MTDERMSGSDSFTTTETYSDDESCAKRPKVWFLFLYVQTSMQIAELFA